MSSSHITYKPRSDSTPEAEVSVLANVYSFVIDSANKNTSGMSKTKGTSVRYTEGVGDVERQSD